MTKKQRKEEVIRNITHTIESESVKPNGNMELVNKLTERLNAIKDGTFVSKVKKKN